jgi:hypothetical protein
MKLPWKNDGRYGVMAKGSARKLRKKTENEEIRIGW